MGAQGNPAGQSIPVMGFENGQANNFNYGQTKMIHQNLNNFIYPSKMNRNVVMKAFSNKIVPDFSVSGSGAILLQKNF